MLGLELLSACMLERVLAALDHELRDTNCVARQQCNEQGMQGSRCLLRSSVPAYTLLMANSWPRGMLALQMYNYKAVQSTRHNAILVLKLPGTRKAFKLQEARRMSIGYLEQNQSNACRCDTCATQGASEQPISPSLANHLQQHTLQTVY